MGEFRSRLPDVFIPFQLDPNATDQTHYFFVGARLKPGVSLEQAQARVGASTEAFRERFPGFGEDDVFTAVSMREATVAYVRESVLVLMGAVSLVLLIACANVANLLLARAAGRRREMAIRSAIGAGRWRIARQLLTESVLLASIAGAIGLALGAASIRALLAINTAGLPRLGPGGSFVHIDWRVAAFTVGISAVTGILFGLIPALQSSRTDLSGALKAGGGRSGRGIGQNRTRSALVVSEVALALVLLVGATLLIRSSVALTVARENWKAAPEPRRVSASDESDYVDTLVEVIDPVNGSLVFSRRFPGSRRFVGDRGHLASFTKDADGVIAWTLAQLSLVRP
jgi:hypothetical protein